MKKKYYYTFQVFEKHNPLGQLENLVVVEVVASNYEEAEKMVRPLLPKNDPRNIRLSGIVEKEHKK